MAKQTKMTCVPSRKKSLDTIYLTSITQKAERTYIRVLEGADVGAFCGHTWWRKPENRGKPPTLDGRPPPCHMLTPGFDPGSQWWQASALTTALSRCQVETQLVHPHS